MAPLAFAVRSSTTLAREKVVVWTSLSARQATGVCVTSAFPSEISPWSTICLNRARVALPVVVVFALFHLIRDAWFTLNACIAPRITPSTTFSPEIISIIAVVGARVTSWGFTSKALPLEKLQTVQAIPGGRAISTLAIL
jgi:hypothetical protein